MNNTLLSQKPLQLSETLTGKLKWIGIVFLLFGFLLKIGMISVGDQLFVLGCTLLVIYGYFEFIRTRKENITTAVTMLSVAFSVLYVMFRIQYWPGTNMHFYAAMAAMVVASILFVVKMKTSNQNMILFAVCFGLALLLYYTPNYRLLYAMRLNATLNGATREYNFYDWDRYSWYLYKDGLYDDALAANGSASLAYENSLADASKSSSQSYQDKFSTEPMTPIEVIVRHREQIMSKSWNKFP